MFVSTLGTKSTSELDGRCVDFLAGVSSECKRIGRVNTVAKTLSEANLWLRLCRSNWGLLPMWPTVGSDFEALANQRPTSCVPVVTFYQSSDRESTSRSQCLDIPNLAAHRHATGRRSAN